MGMFGLIPRTISVNNQQEADDCVRALANTEWIAVDTETTGLSRIRDRAVIISLSDGKRRWTIWPQCIPMFKDLLEDPSKKLIMWNANFDQWMLKNVGINTNRLTPRLTYRVYDAMVMHALFRSDLPHDLKSVARTLEGIEMIPFATVFDLKGKSKSSIAEVLLSEENYEKTNDYASLDAFATYKLFWNLRKKLEATPAVGMSMYEYFVRKELKFTKVLWDLECTGISVDKESLVEMAPALEDKLLKLRKWFTRMTGDFTINLNTGAKDVELLFFGHLGRIPEAVTETGKPALSANQLKKWGAYENCEYSRKLLEYRKTRKDLSDYVTGILENIHTDGKIHTTYNQVGARTGRLSSSVPNLQNQPGSIRGAYIADPNTRLFARDYSQLEMRLLAHYSGDKTLVDAINSGQDVHCATAVTMFGVSYDSVIAAREADDTAAQLCDAQGRNYDKTEHLSNLQIDLLEKRAASKTINFGILYGQGPWALGDSLGISADEAKLLIAIYFDKMPSVTKYLENSIREARKIGFCTTMQGRRRHLPRAKSVKYKDRSAADRVIKNSPIQGGAAETCRDAMINVYESDALRAAGNQMLLQVHDEIVNQVPVYFDGDPEFDEEYKRCMEHPFIQDLIVELHTSGASGDNWKACK